MKWLCSCGLFVVFPAVLGLIVTVYLAWFGYLWWRRREMRARILREACAVCDQPVHEAEDGTYVCSHCGFDMGWRTDPARKATVEDIREIRLALLELDQGMGELELAVLYAKANVWGLGSADLKYQAVARAEGHFLDGLSALERLARRIPHLVEMAFPNDRIGDLSMRDGDVNGVLGLVLSAGIRRKVREGLIEALKDSRASYVELEIMLETLGAQLQD